MEYTVQKGSAGTVAADVVVICCFAGKKINGGKRNNGNGKLLPAKLQKADGGLEIDRLFQGHISKLIEAEHFTGAEGKSRLLFTGGKIPARYVLLMGLGDKRELSVLGLRKIGAQIAKHCQEVKAASLAFALQSETIAKLSPDRRLQSIIEGIIMGNYRFDRYHTSARQDPATLAHITVLSDKARTSAMNAIEAGQAIALGTCFARDLCNLPGQDLTPRKLAHEALRMAKLAGLSASVMGPEEIKKERMGAFLAVAQGSHEPPALIRISYKPAGKTHKTIALVGKGVTFDSGGISIKPSRNMHEMKSDMGGAAVVLGAMMAIARLKPKVAIEVYIPSAENLPDGMAFKPGDILTARNGKTIEVISTDAEGRLLLADALDYAIERKPDYIIDFATLTGGAEIAVGELYAAVMGTDQQLVDKILNAARAAGEYAWQLPLEKQYLKTIQRGPADLMNAGGSSAQTITAGLFLSQFVGHARWAHLDIAACEWTEETNDLCPKGGTGAMVPTLVTLLSSW